MGIAERLVARRNWRLARLAALPLNLSVPAEVRIGARLARLEIPLTRSYIVASAIATRDYQEVHHDPDIARARGSLDVFLNILSTTGLVARQVTDAFGPDAHLRKLGIKLGATAYPGDTLAIEGQVTGKTDTPEGCDVTVRVRPASGQRVSVDLLSRSRVGKGDFGTNGRRIGKFLEALDAALASKPA